MDLNGENFLRFPAFLLTKNQIRREMKAILLFHIFKTIPHKV